MSGDVNFANRVADVPEKNEFSHPHDGLQYACFGHGEHMEVLGRQRDRANSFKPVVAAHNFDPLNRGAA